jgi:hypothetical protein
MPAPVGNQFWKMRSKHGRDKIFKTPEILWEAAEEYFQWCVDNPLLRQDYVGKDADEVWRKFARPFTIAGLTIFLDVNPGYWHDFRKQNAEDKGFTDIFKKIDAIIYNQKYEGAAIGLYNPMMISRDLGLIDKSETDVKSGGEKLSITFVPARRDGEADKV